MFMFTTYRRQDRWIFTNPFFSHQRKYPWVFCLPVPLHFMPLCPDNPTPWSSHKPLFSKHAAIREYTIEPDLYGQAFWLLPIFRFYAQPCI